MARFTPACRRLVLATAFAGGLAAPAGAETTYVTAARMLDVESGKYIADPLITVTDGKVAAHAHGAEGIKAAIKALAAPVPQSRSPAPSATVLPGSLPPTSRGSSRPNWRAA